MFCFSAFFDFRVFVSSPNCCADFRFSCVVLAWSISVTESRGGRDLLVLSLSFSFVALIAANMESKSAQFCNIYRCIHYRVDNTAYNKMANISVIYYLVAL